MAQLRWEGFGGDLERIREQLERLVARTQGRAILLMDSAGRLLTWVGDEPQFDVTTFVSLLAADFCATRELARLLGEEQFHSVSHQGEGVSLYLTQLTEKTILALAYDRESTLGLVRYCVQQALPALSESVRAGFARPEMDAEPLGEAFGAEARERLARLFDSPL
ncbi:MAG: roadblock/LC7 domain-containing protein [Candidatus Eisenbacteria bacterium]